MLLVFTLIMFRLRTKNPPVWQEGWWVDECFPEGYTSNKWGGTTHPALWPLVRTRGLSLFMAMEKFLGRSRSGCIASRLSKISFLR